MFRGEQNFASATRSTDCLQPAIQSAARALDARDFALRSKMRQSRSRSGNLRMSRLRETRECRAELTFRAADRSNGR